MVWPGCDCGGDETTTSSTGTTTSTNEGGGGEGGASTGGGGGAGGGGGQGGGVVAVQGAPATETVSAGRFVKSPNYSMVFTLGQPTQNQGKSTSPSYRMQGGVVGASGN
ncbi:hypothetical protein [Chondromyces apiculatus]|nr:hypothetical protein [Chondromyces apiculatus]